MHPAAEMIVVMEMRVIGGEGGQPLAFVEQLVEQIEAFAAVGFDRAAMVVDLDRMRNVDGEPIGKGKLRPGRMRDADEGAGVRRAARQLGAAFLRRAGREVERQSRRDDMPKLAGGSLRQNRPASEKGASSVI
jgi:hypothetical protein